MVKIKHKDFVDAVPIMLLKICIVCERKRNKSAILTLNKKNDKLNSKNYWSFGWFSGY